MSDNQLTPAQPPSEGSGTLFARRYWVEVLRPECTPRELIAYIKANFPEFSPSALADFRKSRGEEGALAEGDEFDISILGPWNGGVRVTDVGDQAFEFVTLEGHPEAGIIRFSAEAHPDFPDGLHFEIRSLARSRDGLVAFASEKLGVGMFLQELSWRTFCERVAEHCGGEQLGPVQVRTLDEEDLTPPR